MYGAVTPLKQSRDATHVVAETIMKSPSTRHSW